MPQDQKFCSRFYSGQDRADADFPALVTAKAVAVFITGLVRAHFGYPPESKTFCTDGSQIQDDMYDEHP
jgi:hypothetical protein